MMLFVEITSPQQLASTLGELSDMAYAVLFLGALFETLLPFALVIPGEFFFLSGAMLAGMQVLELWAVTVVLYAGGILGDNVSYWMGRHYGQALFARIPRWPIVGRFMHDDNYRRGREFFQRRGALAVLTARLSGPLSWVTPAMAGIFRLDYPTFLRFNTLGVIIGIGEFILLGYFFSGYLIGILPRLGWFGITIVMFLAALSAAGLLCRHFFIHSRRPQKINCRRCILPFNEQ